MQKMIERPDYLNQLISFRGKQMIQVVTDESTDAIIVKADPCEIGGQDMYYSGNGGLVERIYYDNEVIPGEVQFIVERNGGGIIDVISSRNLYNSNLTTQAKSPTFN